MFEFCRAVVLTDRSKLPTLAFVAQVLFQITSILPWQAVISERHAFSCCLLTATGVYGISFSFSRHLSLSARMF